MKIQVVVIYKNEIFKSNISDVTSLEFESLEDKLIDEISKNNPVISFKQDNDTIIFGHDVIKNSIVKINVIN